MTPVKSPLILASASPRRRKILDCAGIKHEVFPAEVDETPRRGESPMKYAARLAREKAQKAAGIHRRRWVLAADTVVVLDGKMMGKPGDRKEAERMLRSLSGKEHRVITGYCLTKASSRRSRERVVVTRVRFKVLSAREIRWYLNTGEHYDKAGGYAIQGKASFMVKEIRGSYTNVVGLPLTEVVEALQELGAVDLFV